MEGKKRAARITVLVAALLAACLLLGCAGEKREPQHGAALPEAAIVSPSPTNPATAKPAPATSLPSPAPGDDAQVEACFSRPGEATRNQYTVRLETDGKTLSGEMQLSYYNSAGEALSEIWLHIYPNAVAPGCFSVKSVTFGGAAADYTLHNDASLLCVPLSRALLPGECVTFAVVFSMDIPERADRLGRSEDTIALGNFLPVAAVYENGGWRKDAYSFFGDAFYSDVSDYTVEFRAPEGYVLAASGDILGEETQAGMAVTRIQAQKMREFAAVLTRGAECWELSGPDGVTVRSVAKSMADIEFMGTGTIRAMTFYAQRIGPYPYGTVSVAPCGMRGAGMEYPGLMLIGEWYLDADRRDMAELIVAHEAAHQWWYAVVGTDQISEPWVDEALCEFLSFDYIRETYGEAAYAALYKARFSGIEGGPPAVPLGSPLSAFDENTYFESVYAYGCGMYRELYEKIGKNAFYGALKSLYESRRFARISGSDLIEAFSRAAGEDLTGWFNDKLSAQRG